MEGFNQIKWNSTINLIVILIVGLLLLIFPIESLNIACYLIASMLMLAGLAYILRIIKNKSLETNGEVLSLVLSISAIAISITIFVNPLWIIKAINSIIGLFLIINSSLNIENLLKFRKNRTTSWWIFLSLIIIILIFGIIVIIDPEFLAKIIVRLEGATLIIDTLITFIISLKVKKLLKLTYNEKEVKEITTSNEKEVNN